MVTAMRPYFGDHNVDDVNLAIALAVHSAICVPECRDGVDWQFYEVIRILRLEQNLSVLQLINEFTGRDAA